MSSALLSFLPSNISHTPVTQTTQNDTLIDDLANKIEEPSGLENETKTVEVPVPIDTNLLDIFEKKHKRDMNPEARLLISAVTDSGPIIKFSEYFSPAPPSADQIASRKKIEFDMNETNFHDVAEKDYRVHFQTVSEPASIVIVEAKPKQESADDIGNLVMKTCDERMILMMRQDIIFLRVQNRYQKRL